ncbi:MAG TPA: 4Fe-4S binding protein [Bryobacteraceae bacterium]|nr:4Fe-4S binding protein [Bryobacteraceae bacterium]
MVWLRRGVQSSVLLLFLYLFLETAEHPINQPGAGVKLFFELDPLAALASWLAAHAIPAGVLLAAATLAATAVFGRWFCGWICPFGTLHQFFASLRRGRLQDRIDSGGYTRWHKAKYFVLAVFLGGALAGSNVVGWLDPFSFLFRGLATAVYPAVNQAIVGLFTWLYNANPLDVTAVSEPVYEFLRRHFLAVHQPHYFGNVLLGATLAAVVALNFLRPRFWCRYLCPLGALLGLAGKYPVVRLRKNPQACNDCGLCLADCQGGARSGGEWRPEECFYCVNCRAECSPGAIGFELGRPRKTAPLDLGRRRALACAASGVAGALLFQTHPLGNRRSFNPALVRPPGSLGESEFLARCIRCGECMKVCPTNAIHPAAWEAGLEGAWSPVMKMTIGYCEYECTLCSQVCPTGAIRPLDAAAKQAIRIGLAYIDRNRCLPYAYARPCIVCEEHCPTPKKAIWLQEVEVAGPRGERVTVQQPHVDPDLCIGCGICTNKCVIQGAPAVLVSSAGETRNPENGVLLG